MLRIGQGFDLHRLVPGRKLILAGIEIPYHLGLEGHSDADVLLHAIIDSLIGALALGDIGAFFPDTDKQYKNANSRILLQKVWEKITNNYGYKLVNLDTTVIIEEPKLRPFIDLMRHNIACDLGVDLDQISIKAKTSEKIGIVGTKQAVIAESVVLLSKSN